MASNFSILVDVELDAKRSDLQRKLNELSKGTKVKIDSSDVNKLADATDKAATKAADMILTYQAANTILRRTTEIISAMTEQVFELDRATTDFKKVSDLQGQSLDRYVDKLADMGASVARTASEMVDAATEFRKSGFSDDDSATLALVATQLQNVADGSLSAGEASNFIISQMKAFNLEAKDATHIIDALNAVSNNFAVSSSDLSLNIGKASAALAVGNTKYEQALGLMTAGTEVVRNASRVARGLVSVQSRLTQTLDEQSSTGKALTAWYAQYGIALQDQEGQLRSTFDILQDVAEIWPTLTTNEKDYFLLQQAGANQTQNLAAILSNFQTAIDATATAYNSAGSAAAENAKYMESLEAKVQSVKATFQDLANNVIENDLLKALLDLANKGLQLLNTKVGTVISQFALLSAGMTGLVGVGRYIVGPLFGKLGTTFAVLAKGGASFSAVLSAIGAPLTIAGIAAAGIAIWNIYKHWKDANPTFEKASEYIADINKQLENNQQRLEELEKIPWYDRTAEINDEIQSIKQENEELKDNLALREEQRKKAYGKEKQEVYTGQHYEVFAPSFKVGNRGKPFETYDEALQALNKTFGEATVEARQYEKTIRAVEDTVKLSGEELDNEYIRILKELQDELKETGKLSDESINLWKRNEQGIRNSANAYQSLKEDGEDYRSTQEEMNNSLVSFDELLKNTTVEQKTLATQFGVTQEQAEKLKKANKDLYQVIEDVDGVLVINVKKLFDVSEQAAETNKAYADLIATQVVFSNSSLNVSNKIQQLYALAKAAHATGTMFEMLQAYATGDIHQQRGVTQTLKAKYGTADWNQLLDIVWSDIQFADSPKIGGTSTSVGTKTGTTSKSSPTDEALKEFQSHYKNLQHMRNMDEIDEERYYGDLRYLIDQYIQDATANMEEYGLDVEQINQNMYQYEEEIYNKRGKLDDKLAKDREKKAKEQARKTKEALEQQKKAYEAAFGYMADKIQEEIDALEKEKESVTKYWDDRIASVQKVNDELERQIQLEDLQANVAKARQNQMLVFKDGRFQYISNMDEVSQAQAELDKFQRDEVLRKEVENLNKLKDQALDSIDQQIKSWEDYKKQWSSVADNYKKEQDRLLAEQVLGIEQEGANWKSRLDSLQSYVSQYNAIMAQLSAGSFGGGGSSFGGGYSSGGGGSSGGGWSSAEMSEGFVSGSGSSKVKGAYRLSDEGAWIKYTGDAGGGSRYSTKVPSSERRTDLKGQTIHLGNTTIKYDDLGYHQSTTFGKSKWSGHANGTTDAPGGISLVGEKGPELRVLNSGDGIVPADVTKNLWQWGKTTPSNLMAHLNAGGVDSNTMSVVIESLNLPEVHNGEDFVKYLQNNLWAKTVQFASKK